MRPSTRPTRNALDQGDDKVATVIKIRHKGNFDHLDRFLKAMTKRVWMKKLAQYGEQGVEALRNATPKTTGKTAESWSYEIREESGNVVISWKNSNVNKHVNIAVILQYGHGTRNGGYVKGIDYINPALKPVFDEIANSAWKEVISA